MTRDDPSQPPVDPVKERYDRHAYRAWIIPESHPWQTGAIATLMGLRPASPDRCRVLEIGCAHGTNLLYLARHLPGSAFVGVDVSAGQIDHGRAEIARAGLSNIDLVCADILDFAKGPGSDRFDYIVAHGVFSWVSDDVKRAIFRLCADLLAESGIAYISYNTYPGWAAREGLRQLLRLEAAGAADVDSAARQVHRALDLLEKGTGGMTLPHLPLLRQEIELVRAKDPVVLYHDELGEVNDPCYFLQFVDWAAEHGLRYVGDTDFPLMWPDNLPPGAREVLTGPSIDRLRAEQYLDYLVNRHFRRSILCRAGAPVSAAVDIDAVATLHARSRLEVLGDAATGGARYATPAGAGALVSDPAACALLDRLGGPACIPVADAVEAALGTVPGSAAAPSDPRKRLLQFCLEAYAKGVIDLSLGQRPAHPEPT